MYCSIASQEIQLINSMIILKLNRTINGEKILLQTGWTDPYVLWRKKTKEELKREVETGKIKKEELDEVEMEADMLFS